MSRGARLGKATAAVIVAVALQAPPVSACGYHATMADLSAAHGRSIDVALAVRDALDREELRPLAPMPPALGFLRASRMLQDFRPLVPALVGQPDATIAVLLVDSGLWTRYTVSADGASAQTHVAGPMEGERVIVTSEAVLRAMLEGGLDPARAARLGMLVHDRST